MNAIPQPKTHQIVDRINALQGASARFIDTSQVTPLSREWRAIKHDIDQLMRVDACAAWELTGSWRALAGDVEGAEAAFRNSVALGETDVNRENWMITRLNLGLFSAAQALYREFGVTRNRDMGIIARYGFLAGAIGRTAEVIEDGRVMGVEWDDAWAQDVIQARAIMNEIAVTDDEIAQRLDCAGNVLRRLRLRPVVRPKVLYMQGVCRIVSYKLVVPVSFQRALEIDHEAMLEQDKLAYFNTAAFSVNITGTSV
ncbi:hypothetical protein NK8_37430 [Caballeronia sp. NK8]|uniref:hypothetical protein n=1 Tax=Caballeronia sp. NK8 TaxID=140098 RepID=UPI001BB524B4|nr:hypothetical protein [Caballeronia sp. NK8]BCQ25565.1 hypothetical protein NK8_37430 [Caballeronia sp. NK8]